MTRSHTKISEYDEEIQRRTVQPGPADGSRIPDFYKDNPQPTMYLSAYYYRGETCDNTLTQEDLEKHPHFKTLADDWVENIDTKYRPYLEISPNEIESYEKIMQDKDRVINPKCFGSEYFAFPLVLSFEMGGEQSLDFGQIRKID